MLANFLTGLARLYQSGETSVVAAAAYPLSLCFHKFEWLNASSRALHALAFDSTTKKHDP
jgi:hypothetical protein